MAQSSPPGRAQCLPGGSRVLWTSYPVLRPCGVRACVRVCACVCPCRRAHVCVSVHACSRARMHAGTLCWERQPLVSRALLRVLRGALRPCKALTTLHLGHVSG